MTQLRHQVWVRLPDVDDVERGGARQRELHHLPRHLRLRVHARGRGGRRWIRINVAAFR